MISQMCLFLDLRKKVLDFYQRNSMSAYCVAFSYRPVTEVGSCDKFQHFTFILIMARK